MAASAAAIVTLLLLWTGRGLAEPPGGKVSWDSVFAWIERDWPKVPQMSTDELSRRLAGSDAPLLIDTRSRKEYAVSHLPRAVNAESATQLRAALRDVPAGRSVVLYCSVGVRSSKAAAALMKDGRQGVFNLRGSIFQWANEARTLERDGQSVRAVHPYNREWGALLRKELHAENAP